VNLLRRSITLRGRGEDSSVPSFPQSAVDDVIFLPPRCTFVVMLTFYPSPIRSQQQTLRSTTSACELEACGDLRDRYSCIMRGYAMRQRRNGALMIGRFPIPRITSLPEATPFGKAFATKSETQQSILALIGAAQSKSAPVPPTRSISHCTAGESLAPTAIPHLHRYSPLARATARTIPTLSLPRTLRYRIYPLQRMIAKRPLAKALKQYA